MTILIRLRLGSNGNPSRMETLEWPLSVRLLLHSTLQGFIFLGQDAENTDRRSKVLNRLSLSQHVIELSNESYLARCWGLHVVWDIPKIQRQDIFDYIWMWENIRMETNSLNTIRECRNRNLRESGWHQRIEAPGFECRIRLRRDLLNSEDSWRHLGDIERK